MGYSPLNIYSSAHSKKNTQMKTLLNSEVQVYEFITLSLYYFFAVSILVSWKHFATIHLYENK